jgi:uncharacterized coiled-coil DUF342 family protein
LDDSKKPKAAGLADLPDGLREIAELPSAQPEAQKFLPSAAQGTATPLPLPEKQARPERPKTQKEQELDALIALRQGVIDKLKAKNPDVGQCRSRIAAILPSLSGKGASHTMKLVEEVEKLEFSISTEAYTPRKEKDMIKRIRLLNTEISKHKEIDSARKKIDAERASLRFLLSEIKSLEHELVQARKACDAKYAEVLAERKAAYEQRQHRREERKERKYEKLRQRVRQERKKEYDSDMAKYMKDYDDTVSMDEIVVIEKKERKKEE